MFKKLLFCFAIITINLFAADEIEIEKRREQQAEFETLIKSQDFNIEESPQEEEESQEFILDINSITLEGNTILETFQYAGILRKYTGKEKNLNLLINELENKYINKGYITTRVVVDIENSDFSQGNIILIVNEGKIGKIYFDEKENNAKAYITFPQRENNILNIRDLDQGIDNLADNSTMDIKPAQENNYSDILVKRGESKIFGGGINYNDLGQKDTGRHRYKFFLYSQDLLGLNESVSFSFQEKLEKRKKGDTENYSIGISVPYKYWTFSYSYDHSEYLRVIRTAFKNYYATGNTVNQNFGVRKVIHRNENHKIDFGANITLKNAKNYIDNIKLTTGSRHLSVLTLDTGYTGRVGGGLLSANLSTSFGLKKFGANIDNEEWYRDETSPKAQFRKYNFNLSWYKPIEKFYYKINTGAQYSKDILYSQEKLGIGDDTTVRGFKDESLQGDKGYYIRNEIGYRGLQFLEPFIAYDYGRVFNNKVEFGRVDTIQGIAFGFKLSFKNLEGSITFAKPIDKPEYFEKNKFVIYTSLTYRF